MSATDTDKIVAAILATKSVEPATTSPDAYVAVYYKLLAEIAKRDEEKRG